jgi:hypothetical protein
MAASKWVAAVTQNANPLVACVTHSAFCVTSSSVYAGGAAFFD